MELLVLLGSTGLNPSLWRGKIIGHFLIISLKELIKMLTPLKQLPRVKLSQFCLNSLSWISRIIFLLNCHAGPLRYFFWASNFPYIDGIFKEFLIEVR